MDTTTLSGPGVALLILRALGAWAETLKATLPERSVGGPTVVHLGVWVPRTQRGHPPRSMHRFHGRQRQTRIPNWDQDATAVDDSL